MGRVRARIAKGKKYAQRINRKKRHGNVEGVSSDKRKWIYAQCMEKELGHRNVQSHRIQNKGVCTMHENSTYKMQHAKTTLYSLDECVILATALDLLNGFELNRFSFQAKSFSSIKVKLVQLFSLQFYTILSLVSNKIDYCPTHCIVLSSLHYAPRSNFELIITIPSSLHQAYKYERAHLP